MRVSDTHVEIVKARESVMARRDVSLSSKNEHAGRRRVWGTGGFDIHTACISIIALSVLDGQGGAPEG